MKECVVNMLKKGKDKGKVVPLLKLFIPLYSEPG
jgi:hypothetical protein